MTWKHEIPVLGITGGVGAGKSTVLSCLKDGYGAVVLECDRIGRVVQKKGGSCYEAIRQLFGEEILSGDGEFDRQALAEVVYSSPEKLRQLEQIVHPAVKAQVCREIEGICRDVTRRKPPFIVLEAALLLEDHYDEICDEIWFIRTAPGVRIRRLMASRGYSSEKCGSIMRAQKSDEFYEAGTQLIIDNSGDQIDETRKQLDKGLKEHGFLQHWQRQQR